MHAFFCTYDIFISVFFPVHILETRMADMNLRDA
jgi:hypothetical protein